MCCRQSVIKGWKRGIQKWIINKCAKVKPKVVIKDIQNTIDINYMLGTDPKGGCIMHVAIGYIE